MEKEDFRLYTKRVVEMKRLKRECETLKTTNYQEYMNAKRKYMELKELTDSVKNSMHYLNEEEKKFMYLKYIKKLSSRQLQSAFHISHSGIYYKVDRIIDKIEFYI